MSAVARTVDRRNMPKTLNRHKKPAKPTPGKCASSSCTKSCDSQYICACKGRHYRNISERPDMEDEGH